MAFKQVGQILVNKAGDKRRIELDNANLEAFIDVLIDHYRKHVEGKSKEDIFAAQKLHRDDPNHLPKIILKLYPNESKLDFVLENLALKVD